jgi:hypothetical protein
MTISSETNRVQFAGSGTTGPFTISSLEIQANTQVAVTHTDSAGVNTDYVLTTDYTINTDLTELTTVANVESGETLTVIIDVPLTQGVDYKNTGTFDAEVNEDALDKLTLINKQQTELLARSIKLEVNSAATDITVADGVEDKGIKFDASGNLVVTTNDIDTALDAAAASAAAAAVSESNASSSASAASSSASAASTAQTNAETAETNAETAQTAAEAAQTAAETAETNAETAQTNAESAAAAVAHPWLFDATTTMADPGTGDIRLNNATVSSVTQIAISASTASTGNPDVSAEVITWDDSTSTNKGTLILKKNGTPATFAIFTISGTITDNTTWLQIPVTHVTSNGALSASDKLHTQFIRTGDKGEAGAGSLSNVVEDLTPQLGGDLDCNGSQIQWSQGADVASAAALAVLTDGNYFDVTGTTTITSINTTGGAGTQIKLHFDGALTLTHHATNLILPGGANITTAAGDEAEFIEYGAGTYRCTNYTKADGTAVVSSGAGGWVTLRNVALSADSSVDFEDGVSGAVLDSTYDEYRIRFKDVVTGTDGAALRARFATDSGVTFVTCTGHRDNSSEASATYAGAVFNSSTCTLATAVGNVGGEAINGSIFLGYLAGSNFKYADTRLNLNKDSIDGQRADVYIRIPSTSVIPFVQIIMSSGTLASGNIILEGRSF